MAGLSVPINLNVVKSIESLESMYKFGDGYQRMFAVGSVLSAVSCGKATRHGYWIPVLNGCTIAVPDGTAAVLLPVMDP